METRMQSTAARAGVAVAGVAAAVALFVVLSGDEDEGGTAGTTATATTPVVEKIVVRDGDPVGGVRELRFRKGERIQFTVQSDRGEAVHVHGYDLEKPVPGGGGPVPFDFAARLDGVFEVELHDHEGDTQIAEITVEP
jgi:hypothetical protein